MRKKLKYLILCYFYWYWYKHPGEVCYIIYKGGFFFGGGIRNFPSRLRDGMVPRGPVGGSRSLSCAIWWRRLNNTWICAISHIWSFNAKLPVHDFHLVHWLNSVFIKFKTKWDWFRKSSMRLLSHIFMSTDNSMIHVALYPVHIDMTKRNIFYTLSL